MNKRFGELLSEGFTSVAKCQGKRVGDVVEEVAEALNFTPYNIQAWLYHGKHPREAEQVAFLVRYCATNGRVARDWANSLLIQARYPHREALLNELFHEDLQRSEVPRIYENLPPRYGDFLGREADLARVLQGLESRWPLVSIEGMGGQGKTTLAIVASRRCLSGINNAFAFDAVVWVSAKDHPEQKLWLNEVLDTIGRVLNFRYITQLSPEEKPSEVDKLLRTHRALVIIDNFETIEDPELEHWMQQVPEPSKVLITGRYAKLRRVWDIHLKGLREPEALELIRLHARRLGLPTLESAGDDVLLPLAHVTEGNPQAIEMALGHVKYSALNLIELIDHLHSASQTVNDVFEYLFKHAWELLTENARKVLGVMPFFVDSVSKEALSAAASLKSYYLDTALGQLLEMSLVDVNNKLDEGKRRYSVHPLTRAFAETTWHDVPELESEARELWSDFYVQYIENYGDDDLGEEIGSGKAGHRERLREEIKNIRVVIEWCFQNKSAKAVRLVERITTFLLDEGEWVERLNLCRRALDIAETPESRAGLLTRLAWSYQVEGDYEQAQKVYRDGLEIARGYEIQNRLIQLLRDQGRLYSLQGNYAESIRLCTESLELAERIGQEIGILLAKHFRARAMYEGGDLQKSKQEFLELLPKFQGTHPRQLLVTLRFLGNIAIAEGRFDEARAYLQEALDNVLMLYYEVHEKAQLYQSFGELEKAIGNFDEAYEAYEKALDFATRLGMKKEMQKWEASMEEIEQQLAQGNSSGI